MKQTQMHARPWGSVLLLRAAEAHIYVGWEVEGTATTIHLRRLLACIVWGDDYAFHRSLLLPVQKLELVLPGPASSALQLPNSYL